MNIISVTSVIDNARAAYRDAIGADHAWQSELEARGVERYSKQAKGSEGSSLRELYSAKAHNIC